MGQKRLLLVGGGHAHLEVVRQLGGAGITLVSPDQGAAYSGMLPGLIAGDYVYRQAHVDLPALCRRFGVDFVQSRVTDLDLEGGIAHCQNQRQLDFDVLSINVGSSPSGVPLNALPVKPVS